MLKEDYDAANTHLRKSKKIFQQLGDRRGLANVNGIKGRIYLKTQNINNAVKYLKNAYQEVKDIKYTRGICFWGRDYAKALCQSDKKDRQKGLELLVETIRLFNKLGLKTESKETDRIIQKFKD